MLPTPLAPPDNDLLNTAYLKALRQQMVKFAQLQLSDSALAEDAVQEALAGALVGAERFSGKAALKTWVFAILKNKIADLLRHKHRMVDASSLCKENEEGATNDLFDQRGHWLADGRPTAWDNPEASLEQQQFWHVFEACLEGVPTQQSRVFMMREFMGFETDEICDTVGITSANLFVMLHRARLRLRECLDQRWFAKAI